MVYPGTQESSLVQLRTGLDVGKALGEDIPAVLHDVDVAILHRLIIRDVLRITDEAQLRKENIDYVHTIHEVRNALEDGKTQCAVILKSTSMQQLRASADAGVPMPQKSTYFYPKLLTGLVIYPLA